MEGITERRLGMGMVVTGGPSLNPSKLIFEPVLITSTITTVTTTNGMFMSFAKEIVEGIIQRFCQFVRFCT